MFVITIAAFLMFFTLDFSVMEHLGENVDITHLKEKIITLLCTLDLFIYPFDVQVGDILKEVSWGLWT